MCHVCGADYVNIIDFNSHIASHKGITYKCPKCDKTFRSGNTLKNHRRAEDLGKLHTCQQCRKSFQLITLLLNHIKTHSTALYGCQVLSTCYFKTKSYSCFREHNSMDTTQLKIFSAPSAKRHFRHHQKCVVITQSSMDLYIKHLEFFFIIVSCFDNLYSATYLNCNDL